MRKLTKTKKAILTAASCGLIAVLGIGASVAYLTDTDSATNTFTHGSVAIELSEPNYPGNTDSAVKDLVPNEEIAKDPIITNVSAGLNDAIVFLTVDSPIENVTLVSDAGVKGSKTGQQIYYFKDSTDPIATHANNFDSNWTELTAKETYVWKDPSGNETILSGVSTDAAAYTAFITAAQNDAKVGAEYDGEDISDYHLVKRYVFAYNDELQGSTANDADSQTVGTNNVTTALFDKIQVKNVIEGELDELTENVVLNAYAIQADQVINGSGAVTQNLETLWDVYFAQNPAA